MLGGAEWNSAKFHHAAENGMQFKTYELFVSRIFYIIFSNLSGQQVNEIVENETTDERIGVGALQIVRNGSNSPSTARKGQ